ncbi:MAG: ferrous iron transport protein A [Firmicutes bacterium]|nr:ferrous iron transport protein A [Bacillota bacterium]
MIFARRKQKQNKEAANSIYYAKDNSKYVIEMAPEIGLLKSLGIVKDAIVEKIMTYKLGGPVLLQVESCEIAVSKDIAEKIIVRG